MGNTLTWYVFKERYIVHNFCNGKFFLNFQNLHFLLIGKETQNRCLPLILLNGFNLSSLFVSGGGSQ
ncbi:UNVERIFIED_CONTAM: hypothetical protein RMT77_007829 [Armadillidium vulgare]